jgi:ribosomal protein S18 acetylase RimI-like enzyme
VTTISSPIQIRKATRADLLQLVEIARKSFLEAFTANNKLENVMAYLNEAFTETQFEKELANPNSTFFIALSQDEIIGYTKVNLVPAQTDIHDPESLEIARLYLLKDYIGLGLGKKLLELAVDFARQSNKKYIWLGVWEHNPRAINFYERNGFKKFSSHPFPFGDEIQTDWLMKRSGCSDY